MKKILFLGAVAILLSLGLVLVSCGGCPGDGNCVWDPANPLQVLQSCPYQDIGNADALKCAAFKAAETNSDKKTECDC
jgi:hypothetical protein